MLNEGSRNMDYIHRIIDDQIDSRSEAFNAINIVGPKGCGKTRTAQERCKTLIEFQDEEKRAGYLAVAAASPNLFLKNKKPILFDEWQDAPAIWGTIRKDCDDHPEKIGEYFLTGSTSRRISTAHTGTGRISEITMYPMTLYETGESNGSVSLSKILEDPNYSIEGKTSSCKLEDLFYAAARGGWPRCLALQSEKAKLEIAKDYYHQIYRKDASAIDGVKRNEEWMRTLIWAYARNIATLVKKTKIYADVQATQEASASALSAYAETLEDLFVIKDIDAWTPQIRSKAAIRSAKKHIFIDVSIALASLGISPDYFNNDLDLFGHVFENMVIRDLLVYAEAHDARIMHYHDDYGLEADAVYQMSDGKYALIEIRVGANQIDAAEKGLLKFKDVIQKHNEEALKNPKHPGVVYRMPSSFIVICANAPVAFTTKNSVKVIPFGCLKD
jgi:predicted AAA+ superfamily ATPase